MLSIIGALLGFAWHQYSAVNAYPKKIGLGFRSVDFLTFKVIDHDRAQDRKYYSRNTLKTT